MGIKNEKTTNFNWIEFIRVRSTALMLEGGIEPIKKIIEDIEESVEDAKPFSMKHALYDGDLAIVIIWGNASKPEKSREGIMVANKLEKLGAVDHAVWVPTGKIPGKEEIE